MKKSIYTIVSILLSGTMFAQTINFELLDPQPEMQESDVGDMEFADIDGDGDFDLILTGKGGPVLTSLYRNDGSGNFSEIEESVIENVYRSVIAISDVDGDEDLDLLISGTNNFPVLSTNLYLNDGTGTFSLATNTPFEPVEGGDIAFGDIDDDGDEDVLITGFDNTGSGVSKLYTNNDSGIFTVVAVVPFAAMTSSSVEFFDCDGDEDLDVIMAGNDTDNNPLTALYLNDGLGVFSLVDNTNFNNFFGGDIAIGDSDGDNDLDVLICGNTGGTTIATELYLNDGIGTFTLLENTVFSDVSLGEASFNDFDNDGDLDVFVIGTGEGGLIGNTIVGNVYENEGSNNYIVADSLIGGYFSSHAVADIDSDNDMDLVLGGTTTGSPTRATFMYENLTPITVGIEEEGIFGHVMLYPNPSQGSLTLEFQEEIAATITIWSQLGNLVYSKNIKTNTTQLELDLPNGLYFIDVNNENGSFTRKFILNR